MARRDTILVSRTLYQIGIMTLMGAIVWIMIGVYLAATKQPEISVDKNLLEPINTTIDQEVITSLVSRLKVEVDALPQNATIEAEVSRTQ